MYPIGRFFSSEYSLAAHQKMHKEETNVMIYLCFPLIKEVPRYYTKHYLVILSYITFKQKKKSIKIEMTYCWTIWPGRKEKQVWSIFDYPQSTIFLHLIFRIMRVIWLILLFSGTIDRSHHSTTNSPSQNIHLHC